VPVIKADRRYRQSVRQEDIQGLCNVLERYLIPKLPGGGRGKSATVGGTMTRVTSHLSFSPVVKLWICCKRFGLLLVQDLET
jgi:hypothetical protein